MSTNPRDNLMIICALIIYVYIIFFKIDRVGLATEFILAMGFIHILSKVTFSKVKFLIKMSSIRILDFYIIQAVLFTFIVESNLVSSVVPLFLTVFSGSILVGYLTYAIREKISYYR